MLAAIKIRKAAQSLAATNELSLNWVPAWLALVELTGNEATALTALQGAL